jgi:hypothetical protein
MKILLALLSLLAPMIQTGMISVPGTKVSLAPPQGFTPAEKFPGFLSEETGASIMVTEMPAPYEKMVGAFDKDGLATKGMTLLSRKDVTIDGRPSVLLHIRQVAQSIAFLKWIVVTGNEQETALITATFPEEFKTRLSASLEKTVLGAKWDAEAKKDPLEGLNFSVEMDPALKIAGRMTNALMMTRDGALPGKPTDDPLLIVGSAISQVEVKDGKLFAEARLRKTTSVTDIRIRKTHEITINGLSGYEIIADARGGSDSEQPIVIYQVVLFDGSSYFIMQGFTASSEQQTYLGAFSRIARSFRKKP